MQHIECSKYFTYANIRVSENELIFDVTCLNVLQTSLLIVKNRTLHIIKTSNFMIPRLHFNMCE